MKNGKLKKARTKKQLREVLLSHRGFYETIICLLKKSEHLQAKFVNTFTGIPVRIDDELIGNQYYIAVSRELYQQIVLMKEQEQSR